MALHKMVFEFKVEQPKIIARDWSHSGVVGSGDLEILMERKDLNGSVVVHVCTQAGGFDHIWQKLLERFITEKQLGDMEIEINDNYANPAVVIMRLTQAFNEANRI